MLTSHIVTAGSSAACVSTCEIQQIDFSRGRARDDARDRHNNPSEPFEQLCRRAEGIVVESKHPYPKVRRASDARPSATTRITF